MKIAVIGDLHLGAKKAHLDKFLSYQVEELRKISKICSDKKVDAVVQLGDIFDDRKDIDLRVVSTLKDIDFLTKTVDYAIAGNHDVYYKNTNKINSLELLGLNERNINTVIESPVEVKSLQALFVPWICKENEQECISAIRDSKMKYCFGHFEIDGFEMTKGLKCTSTLTANDFFHFDKVFSGHFHLRNDSGSIIYVGTPYQLTWNDFQDRKGFYILEVETGSIEFVDLDNEVFKKVVIDESGTCSDDKVTNCFVKVEVKCERSKKIDGFIDTLTAENFDVTVIDEYAYVKEVGDTITGNTFEMSELVGDFLDEQKFSDSDKVKISELFTKLYGDACLC